MICFDLGKNTGVGYHALLQGIFPTQGLNPRLLHWQADSFTTEPPGKLLRKFNLSSVHSLSRVRLFVTPWIAARQASLSITNSRSPLRLTSIESVMPSSHLILCRPLLLLPPIPPSISLFQWVNSFNEVAKVLREIKINSTRFSWEDDSKLYIELLFNY